jgi:hypothetical protein
MPPSPRPPWSARRVALVVALLLLALAFSYLGWQYWLFKGGIFRTSRFDAAEWLALEKRSNDFSCYRGGMADDIRKNVLRVGQSADEIERVLGRPNFIRNGVHEYYLGMCSGLRIDLDTLDIHFDDSKRLKLVQVVQH